MDLQNNKEAPIIPLHDKMSRVGLPPEVHSAILIENRNHFFA